MCSLCLQTIAPTPQKLLQCQLQTDSYRGLASEPHTDHDTHTALEYVFVPILHVYATTELSNMFIVSFHQVKQICKKHLLGLEKAGNCIGLKVWELYIPRFQNQNADHQHIEGEKQWSIKLKVVVYIPYMPTPYALNVLNFRANYETFTCITQLFV